MVDSNKPPPGGTAELIENSEAAVEQELEDKVGAALEDSLDDEEQPKEQEAKPADGETTDEESNEEAEEKESESEKDAEEEPEKPTTVKLKSGEEVTFDELERGYMKEADYRRKTQEVAKNNRELEAAAQRLIQQDQAVKRELAFVEAAMKELLPKPPDPQLLGTDPVGFLQQKEAYQEAVSRLHRVRQTAQTVDGRLQETQKAQTQEERQAELQQLTEKLLTLRTDQGRTAFYQKASDVLGKAYGFTPDEIGSWTDHRFLVAADHLIKWHDLQSKKMEAVRKAKEAPPMKPAARQSPNARSEQSRKTAWDRLRQDRSEEAAAAALPDDIFA
jgi:plastocyanin